MDRGSSRVVSFASHRECDLFRRFQGATFKPQRTPHTPDFAGPPNFEDVQNGDTPEPGYVLKLDRSIFINGDEFADSSHMFDEVQLVPGDSNAKDLARLRDTDVYVEVVDPMPAMTGHHHRPLLVWVKTVSLAREITQSYGTAATTIEAFYAALRAGNGKLAADFVIPEKTKKGPFSPGALTAFYGSLAEPISLIDIQEIRGNTSKPAPIQSRTRDRSM